MGLLWAIPAGLLVGLALGGLGGGGSILTVPALVYLVGQPVAVATTGSLIIVGLSSLSGMVTHLRAGHVRVRQGLAFGALGVVGSYLGTRLSANVSAPVLLTAFSVLLLLVAALMVRRLRRTTRAAGEPAPEAGWPRDPAGMARLLAAATGVGLLTGFFGVGGGFAVVPALVLVMRFPMPVAVGTSLVVISVNSLTALLARLGTSVAVDWTVVGLFAALAMTGSALGATLARRADPRHLTAAFAALLVLVALYTAARNVPALF